MSFLAPLWLALGLAAAVPVLLHLLRRRSGTRIEFPAVRFLLRAEKEHRRQMRMRNLLVMLLRVAVVLVLALAAARPLGRAGASGHAPTAVAIVLDNSLSTGAVRGGRMAIDALREAGERVLDATTAEDLVWLLTVDGDVAATGAAAARDVLARVQPVDGAGNLVASIERAAALASASGLGAGTVTVLTDGQATAWPRAARTGEVPVTIVTLTDAAPRNSSVRAARPEPARWAPRGAVSIAVSSDDSADVRVVLGERTLARTLAGPNASLTVRGTAGRDGWLAGRVELPPDELRADDLRHFAVFSGAPPAVQVDASAGAFARAAIETLAEGRRVGLGGAISVSGADAVSRRPVLAFAPSDPVRAGAANRALAAAGIPWRFSDAIRDESSVRGGELDGTIVRVRHSLIATGGGTADTLAMAGGGVWAVAGEGYVVVGSAMDPQATDLPISARFLPWIEGVLVRHLLTDGGRIVYATPLASVQLPLGVDELRGAEDRTFAVSGRAVTAPSAAGVYWMRRAGAVVGALVVNAEPAESDLAPLDSAGVAARIVGRAPAVVTARDDVARTAFSSAARRPLAGMMFVALVGLLLVESVVARESRRSQG